MIRIETIFMVTAIAAAVAAVVFIVYAIHLAVVGDNSTTINIICKDGTHLIQNATNAWSCVR